MEGGKMKEWIKRKKERDENRTADKQMKRREKKEGRHKGIEE